MDVIRGLAICGIVFPNMMHLLDPDHGFFGVARRWPETHDRAAMALIVAVFADKMISVLALLFGVGIAWQVRKMRKLQRAPQKLFVRRFLALMLIGAGNYVLFFDGDILVTLGITGLLAGVIIPTRLFARTGWAAFAVTGFLVVVSILVDGVSVLDWESAKDMEAIDDAWHWYLYGDYDDTIYCRLYDLTGYVWFVTVGALMYTLPLALIGALLFNSGAWQIASRCPRKVLPLFLWCAVPGVVLEATYLIVSRGAAHQPGPENSVAAALAGFTPGGSVLLAMAYALGLRMLLSSARWMRHMTYFQHVGRLALSVYVTQNIILGLLFYGYGLGFMETAGPLACIGIGVALNGVLLVLARVYTNYFTQGPLEWVWRVLTYGWKQVKSG